METTVQKIHREFRTSLDMSVLKPDAKISDVDMEMYQMLENFNLTNSKTHNEVSKLVHQKGYVEEVADAHNMILKTQAKIAKYRLISFSKIIDICEKYDLYFGMMSKYSGTIPKENLQEIAEFDKLMSEQFRPFNMKSRTEMSFKDIFDFYNYFEKEEQIYASLPYFIVAPHTDFIEGSVFVNRCLINIDRPMFKLKFNKIELKDPVVLYPMCYKGTLFFAIPTAWGDEADDVDVTTKINVDKINNAN